MSDPRDNDLDPADESADEPSGGSLPPSDELEAALREATESVEARAAERDGGSTSGSADKVLLEALSEELQSGKQQFEELSKERDDLQERLLRLQAEFENFRRRTREEGARLRDLGRGDVAERMLDVLDDFDRTIDAAGDGVDEGFLKGVQLVHDKLVRSLGDVGLTRIDDAGAPFDPNRHDAVQRLHLGNRHQPHRALGPPGAGLGLADAVGHLFQPHGSAPLQRLEQFAQQEYLSNQMTGCL